jgi:broad specificity polyphosphatase/5'/3'-nucleotidase SurE
MSKTKPISKVSKSLIQVTRELLRHDSRSLFEISRQTGIPFYWLRKFSSGEIKNPGADRAQKLYEKLSGKKLKF